MKIAVLDWDTVSNCGDIPTDKLEELGEIKICRLTAPEDTAANIGDADIVLCNKVLITREVMDKCPSLRYIGLFATGYNNVDIACAAEKGIVVCNAGSYSTNAVARQTLISPSSSSCVVGISPQLLTVSQSRTAIFKAQSSCVRLSSI